MTCTLLVARENEAKEVGLIDPIEERKGGAARVAD
jgi:hypothetical protein